MLKDLVTGGTFLLNTPSGQDEIWDELPRAGAGGLDQEEAEVLCH